MITYKPPGYATTSHQPFRNKELMTQIIDSNWILSTVGLDNVFDKSRCVTTTIIQNIT